MSDKGKQTLYLLNVGGCLLLGVADWLTDFFWPDAVQFHNGVVEPVKPRSLTTLQLAEMLGRVFSSDGEAVAATMPHLARCTLARLWAQLPYFGSTSDFPYFFSSCLYLCVCLAVIPFPKKVVAGFLNSHRIDHTLGNLKAI